MLRPGLVAGVAAWLALVPSSAPGPTPVTVTLDGKTQTLTAYRVERAAQVVILSSGDMGWAGFVVDLAEFLASQRVGVLGLNSKTYLESFTSATSHLDPA